MQVTIIYMAVYSIFIVPKAIVWSKLVCSVVILVALPQLMKAQVVKLCECIDAKEKIRQITIGKDNAKLIYTDQAILRVNHCKSRAVFEEGILQDKTNYPFAQVTTVSRDAEYIWVGTLGKGLHIFYQQTKKPLLTSHPLHRCIEALRSREVYEIYKIYRQQKIGQPTTVWLLTNKGVFNIRNQALTYVRNFGKYADQHQEKPDMRKHIRHHFTEITEYKGDLWIVGDGKLLKRSIYDVNKGLEWKKVSTPVLQKALKEIGNVNSMVFDKYGRLWMVGDAIIRYNPTNDEVLKSDPTIFKNREASCVVMDQKEVIWVGTDGGGLFQITDTSKVIQYNMAITSIEKKSARHIRVKMTQNKLLSKTQVAQLRYYIKYDKSDQKVLLKIHHGSRSSQTYVEQHHWLIKSFVLAKQQGKQQLQKFKKGKYTFYVELNSQRVGEVKGKF